MTSLTKSTWLVLVLFALPAFAIAEEITKCVDEKGHITFTTMGCKTTETNASITATPTKAPDTEVSSETNTSEKKVSSPPNSTTSSNSSTQTIAAPIPDTTSQPDTSTQNRREKLGEGDANSVGVGMGL